MIDVGDVVITSQSSLKLERRKRGRELWVPTCRVVLPSMLGQSPLPQTRP